MGIPSRRIVVALVAALGLSVIPRAICTRDADPLYAGEQAAQEQLARGMDRWLEGSLSEDAFRTGSARFNGEWLFGTYMMGAMGYGQTAAEHPALRERHAAQMRRCIERVLSNELRRFDRAAWGGADPLTDLGSPRAHAAYLGYLNIALGLHRAVDPHSPFAALNDRVSEHLARRIDESPIGLVATYPGEVYPVDNAAVIGSLGLHARATGADHSRVLEGFRARLPDYRDPVTGLLYQSVDPRDGAPVDRARGSGTALAAYFLSFADNELSASLHRSLTTHLTGSVLGFGYTREYARGTSGHGDIDSGPVVLGAGVSATGFTLASSRAHGDRGTYTRGYATAHLFGAPVDTVIDGSHRRNFALGGPIGDGLMFALLTARPATAWSEP